MLGAVRIELEPAAEHLHRGRVLLRLHRQSAAVVVGVGALEQPVVVLHQRIAEARAPVAPPRKVPLGPLPVPEAAVREGQAVVHARRLRVEGQHALEELDGARLVAERQPGAAQALEDRGRLRCDLLPVREQTLGVGGPVAIEVGLAKPDDGRQIRGAEVERALERRHRARRVAGQQEELPQVVRPARIAGHQRLGVAQARLGPRVVAGRHQDEPDVAVCLGQLPGGGVRAFGHRREGGEAPADLGLHGLGQERQVRHLHRPDLPRDRLGSGARGRPGVRCVAARGAAGGRRQGQGQRTGRRREARRNRRRPADARAPHLRPLYAHLITAGAWPARARPPGRGPCDDRSGPASHPTLNPQPRCVGGIPRGTRAARPSIARGRSRAGSNL